MQHKYSFHVLKKNTLFILTELNSQKFIYCILTHLIISLIIINKNKNNKIDIIKLT
jgi:hypothetical protein